MLAGFPDAAPVSDYFPRWSPNGRRIVFTRASADGELSPQSGNLAVWIVNTDGTHLRAVTPANGSGLPR